MKSKTTFFTLVVIFSLFACKKNATSPYSNNVIASAHPLASEAGNAIYAQGGNAFDAAIAAAFTLSVVEPSMSGLGGRLQAIYYTSDGIIAGVDASTEVPKNYQPSEEAFRYGYQTIGIPGVVAGLLKLHKERASLPLTTIMAPAIAHAENGFSLLPGEAIRQQKELDKLKRFSGSAHHFLFKDSLSYSEGQTLVQKDLANVLRKIAQEGKSGFYEGEIAQMMVKDIQKNGGILTTEDLKNYNALEARVLKGRFQGNTIHSLYLPSFGAITLQILQILDHLPLSKSENQWAYQLGKATELAYTYRKKQENEDSLQHILSYENAARWAKKINLQYNFTNTYSTKDEPISWTSIDGHTTHLSTADQWGNAVSLTQTIGPNMGSRVATKGLGFLYAVTLGGYLGDYQPGDRANSHISPTIVTREGELIMALGAAGGSRIVTAITQVLSRYLSQKHSLEHALELPRVYPYQDSLWIENHPGVDTLNAQFDPAQFPIKYIDEPARFGRVHAITKKNGENLWIGAADPDWEGTTSYYSKK